MEKLRWIIAAAVSAYACHLAVQHATPIDQALPFLALAVTVVAYVSYPALMLGVPLLLLVESTIADEPTRLLAFGAILAAMFAVGAVPASGRPPKGRPEAGAAPIMTITAILLLRWIPLENVRVGRELVLLALCVGIVLVLGRTPFAVGVAVATALFTPAVPLRTLALPLIVLFASVLARAFGMPRIALTWPSAVALAFVMLFFAWSGIVARAFPYFLRPAKPEAHRTVWREALSPGRSATYDVPEGTRAIVVSGANVAHLRRGAVVGRIEPGGIDVRIGDVADWGYMRRDQIYEARNPLPRDPAGKIREYGYASWVDGAGRVALPRGARAIRVTAAADLPAHASLQVEGFE